MSTIWSDKDTQIFVGMVHYRDTRCSNTLENIFKKAKYPDRVFVGVIQQIHTEKDSFDCLKTYCKKYGQNCPHRSQIQLLEFTHQEAKGPTYARYLQDSLIQSEEFCMQIDAHSDFAQDWDVKATSMWGSIGNEYAVLSTRLPDISVLSTPDPANTVPHTCQAMFDSRGMVVNLPPTYAINLQTPLLSPLWSAGFSFSKCHLSKKVPNDPFLQWMYDGDEFSKFARMWTRGYDVYTPNEVLVAHDYHSVMGRTTNDAPDPMEWMKNGMNYNPAFRRDLYDRGVQRVATLLGFPEGAKDVESIAMLTKYGLGSKRSLDQLIRFTGIDTRAKKVYGDRCRGDLEWVPFKVDADPLTDEGDEWGMGPEVLIAGGNNIPLTSSKALMIVHTDLAPEDPNPNSTVEDVDGDAATAEEWAVRRAALNGGIAEEAEELLLEVEEEALLLSRHRGKELWWLFQFVDSRVERIINEIDLQMGYGQGHKALRLVLLLLPVMLMVFFVAMWVVTESKGPILPSVLEDSKRGKLSLVKAKR